MNIDQYFKKYSPKIDSFDLELILAHILKKSREYVLAHPEKKLTASQEKFFRQLMARRIKSEPIAYLIGCKEFYGLDFKVTRHTLIPRPETELLVEKVLELNPKNKTLIDVGTGSGNIIISLARNLKNKNKYFGLDISAKALRIAKSNAKKNNVDNKIKFSQSDLLNYFLKNNPVNKNFDNFIIIANLPYLSQKIYFSALLDVKKFEPKSALLSHEHGLYHYKKLLHQIKKLKKIRIISPVCCFFEISPEQKNILPKIIKQIFPQAKIKFHKDLAKKWRMVEIKT